MILKYFYLVIILSLNVFAQNKTQENIVYYAIDTFVANPKPENLEMLSKAEADFFKNKSIKTQTDFLAIVVLNCNKAFYENQFSFTQNAISSYEKAWRIFNSKCTKINFKQFDIIENCLLPQGNLYTIIGDYDNAENVIKQYYNLAFRNKNTNQTHVAISNLAIVYQQTGHVDLAIDLLEKMLISNQLSIIEKALFKSNLAANYLLTNEILKAEKIILEAIKIFEKQENQTSNLSNCYKNLSEIYFQKNNFKQAKKYFETAMQFTNKTVGINRISKAKVCYQYAVLLFKMNENYKSKEYLNQSLSNLIVGFNSENDALPNQNKLFANTVLLDILDLKADIYLLENKALKALKTYELLFYIEDLFNNLLLFENSKIINQVRIRNRAEKCIAVYEKLYKIDKKNSYLEAAFLLSEKTKSGVLKNVIFNSKLISNNERKLQQELQVINNDIIKEQQKLNDADLNKINVLINKQNQTMLLLKSKQKLNPKSTEKKLNLNLLFEKLNNDKAVLIEYFVGQNNIYSFALSENKIIFNTIEYSENNKNKIANFIELFASSDAISNDIARYNSISSSVYQMLKLPKKGKKNLIIIPDGLLNFIPFDALITKTSTNSNFAKMKYLMNDFVIGYNNSASFYLDSKALTYKNSILGIFPVFDKTDLKLTFSIQEMKAIKNNFAGKYFENSNANFASFKTNANSFSILHLSTHADSGNIEIPATIRFFDRNVLYSELYNLDIDPELVVLSACQTGIGKLYKSEGAMSIARGFQYAGAQNLLFSLWKVNDFTTSILMSNFYKNIDNKMSFFEANNQSKKDFLNDESISNIKKSPYYWSTFVYYGTLEKPIDFNYELLITIVAVTLFLFFLLSKFYTRIK